MLPNSASPLKRRWKNATIGLLMILLCGESKFSKLELSRNAPLEAMANITLLDKFFSYLQEIFEYKK